MVNQLIPKLRAHEGKYWNDLADVVKTLKSRVERFERAVEARHYRELFVNGSQVEEAYRAVVFYSVAVHSLRSLQVECRNVAEENH